MRRPKLFAAIASCIVAYAVTVSGDLAGARSDELGCHRLALGFIAAAHAEGEIRVGDELMAIDDVSLDQARICKGSKVSVSGRAIRSGKVFLDVALADGHVVRAVPMAEIRRSFRVVNA